MEFMEHLPVILVYMLSLYAHTAGFDWETQGINALRDVLKVQNKEGVAKNVILFVGDGMGVSTINAARIYKGQKAGNTGEETVLEFEKFPNTGFIKTYGSDRQVPDSAQTATAFLSGFKTKWSVVGLKDGVTIDDCQSSKGQEVKSILDYSMEAGKATGIVTTTRVTHATPACAFAHSASRNWEADSNMKNVTGGCKDIAYQLVHDNHDIQVVMGGGRRNFYPADVPDVETNDNNTNKRKDGADLVQAWIGYQTTKSRRHKYVWKKDAFDAIDAEETDYVLGLFGASHMQYELDRDTSGSGEPSLAEMTEKAIKILKRDEDGYFLLVEGGRIDHAHHDSNAKRALEDTVALDDAVKKAVEMTNEEDTLIIVTADHSHPFSLTGYTGRGNPILGLVDTISDEPTIDNLPYTSLLYANGPGAGGPGADGNRTGFSATDSSKDDYLQVSAIKLAYETHSGEDVGVFARGPWAHLFRGVQEQHYIAYVMQYAACVGRYRNCNRPTSAATYIWPSIHLTLYCLLAYMLTKYP